MMSVFCWCFAGCGDSCVFQAEMEPVGMEGVLTSMAASVLHSASGMNQWGMADLTVGLYKLSGRHALEGAVDTITSAPVMDV